MKSTCRTLALYSTVGSFFYLLLINCCTDFIIYQALAMIENNNFPYSEITLAILPSDNECNTDEDSEEKDMSPNNLLSSQLR